MLAFGLIMVGLDCHNLSAQQFPFLKVDNLVSCDTIDTDADGNLFCGTDDSAGESSVDHDSSPEANDIPQFVDGNTLKGLSYSEFFGIEGIENAIEAVVDLSDLQGAVTDSQVPDTITITSVNQCGDVNTVSDPPVKNEVLKWNGTNWVPAAYDTSFTFSIASFSDGEATTQLIGSGVWEANSAMSYTATYNNGPPTSADVMMSNNGGAYAKVGAMTGPAYTTGTNSEGAINYPAAKNYYLRFRLDAGDGVDSDQELETAIYFRNYNFYGAIAKASGFTEADIESLTPYYDTDSNYSVAINSGAGQYIVYAFPTSYTALDEGDDYEVDGGTDFKFNSIAIAMTQDNDNLSITNSAGYTEGYDVYVSNLANLGNATFVANTSDQTINPLYYGITTKTDTFLEADIEGLANNSITNNNKQVWSAVNAGVGEYLLFAFPKRLGVVAFWVGGFEGGFESPETVSVTNVNGWTEDYYAWRSTNSGLGSTVVETK